MQLVAVGDLQTGQRVVFDMPNGSTQSVTLRKVWRYDDGSVTLEFKGREPGMWHFSDKDLLLPVTIRNGRT